MKKNAKQIIFYVVLAIVVVIVCALIFVQPNTKDVTYNDIVNHFTNEEVVSFQIDDSNLLKMKLKDGEEIKYQLASLTIFYEDLNEEIKEQITNGTLTEVEYVPPKQISFIMAWLPIILVVIFLVVMYVLMAKQMSGGGGKMNSFGKSRAKIVTPDEKNKVTFKDVAGADEEKQELEEIVEFLKDPEQFTKLGAKIPHGVMLVGPPGTGKTLLAKAVAGEANVPFFSISGSDFVEMYVGVGASRVRDLFDTARKANSSIIFIDEIDAVGRHRGAGLGGGHDEREQTLNQLLVEMDGFGSASGIIVIAATNRPDVLDPALLRPGRFDRRITVGYPDLSGRVDILKVHSKNKPLEADLDLGEVGRMTVGFTGADLSNLLNEAALLAARRKKSLIGIDDVSDAYIKIIAGTQKKNRNTRLEERKKTAYHEAGHAMLAFYMDLDPVQQISIIPSGNALGYTLNTPTEDKYSVYKSVLNKEIAMLLAGRAAEEIIYGDISGGASNDIERATKIAKNMITRLGMSDVLGPRCFGSDNNEVFLGRDFSSSQDYSEDVAAIIDSEIHSVISGAYELAKATLTEHIDKLHFITEFLLKNELMDGDQFHAVMTRDEVTMEEIELIVSEKRRRSIEANKKREEENKARLEAEEKARKEKEALEQQALEQDKLEAGDDVVKVDNADVDNADDETKKD